MYISIDGNDIGKRLEGLILSDNLEELQTFSSRITFLVDTIEKYIIKQGGKCFLSGGDNILAFLPEEKVHETVKYVNSLKKEEISFSIGIGDDVIDAYLALKYAKSMKKGYICQKVNDQFVVFTL